MPKRKKNKPIVTHEECVSFLENALKEEGPVDLSQHVVEEELKLCFADSTADCQYTRDHTTIIGMFVYVFICFCRNLMGLHFSFLTF